MRERREVKTSEFNRRRSAPLSKEELEKKFNLGPTIVLTELRSLMTLTLHRERKSISILTRYLEEFRRITRRNVEEESLACRTVTLKLRDSEFNTMTRKSVTIRDYLVNKDEIYSELHCSCLRK